MTEVYICDAVRTPIGRYGGALSTVRADDLAAIPIAALLARSPSLSPDAIDDVMLGCANQAGEDNRNVARMASLLAGLPVSVPGMTVNRLCASGAEAVGVAARAIRAGEIDLAIAGGVESMTRAPFVMGKATGAFSREARLEDTTLGWRFVNPRLDALHGTETMPQTAENVARDHGISREDQDRFAVESQRRAALAMDRGYFAQEIVPVEIEGRKGERTLIESDEHPRPGTTLEALAKLAPVVRSGGSVTAGNSSGINDGAAAMIIASHAAVARHGLTPQARILGVATAGVAPREMGIGPVPASRKLLLRLGLGIADFDLIELNEAFAAQVVASLQALGIASQASFVNPNGGAIALGHPLGASGARLVLTATHALRESRGHRALVTMCIGVGQGLALALERV